MNYLDVYNHYIPQKTLGHITPIQDLKRWRKDQPDLFVKEICSHSGQDNVLSPGIQQRLNLEQGVFRGRLMIGVL